MRVYLAGPIFGKGDDVAVGWRQQAASMLRHTVIDPMDFDARGQEDSLTESIVEGDKRSIDGADLLLVNALHGASWGTAMEILYAWQAGKKVVVFVAPGRVSPWLRYHSHHIARGLEEAIGVVNRIGGSAMGITITKTYRAETRRGVFYFYETEDGTLYRTPTKREKPDTWLTLRNGGELPVRRVTAKEKEQITAVRPH